MKNKVIFLLIWFGFHAPLFAKSPIQISVEPGLDGYVRYERWMPVVFELRNMGPDFQGFLQVRIAGTIFEKSLHLGAGGRKQVEILAYYPNAYGSNTYVLQDRDRKEVANGVLAQRILNYQDNLFLVISDTDYNHQFLNGVQNPWGGKTFVAYKKSKNLYSNSIAYSSADAIALGTFSPAQIGNAAWKALMQHVAAGGVLVCSAATDFSLLQDPLLQPALPRISPGFGGTTNGEFLLPRWTASEAGQEPFPAVEIPVQEIQAGMSQETLFPLTGQPLAVTTPYYKGNIIYVGFDYTRFPEPLRPALAHQLNYEFFPTSGSPPAFGNPFRRRLEHNPVAQKGLYDIPGLRVPDVKWFSLYFFIYLLVIGPVQYLLLKFTRRQRLVWISFPAIILVFTGLAVGYAKFRHSAERSLTQSTVVEIFPALGRQTVFEAYGVAMSDSGVFDIQTVSPTNLLTKNARTTMDYRNEPFHLSEDEPIRIVNEQLKQWSFALYESIGSQPADIPMKVHVKLQGNSVSGRIDNGSPHKLEDAFFFYDAKNSFNLGTIAPHSSRTFTLELSNSSPPRMAERHLRDLLNLYSLSHARPRFFLMRMRDAKGAVVINEQPMGTRQEKYLAIYVLLDGSGPKNPWQVDTPYQPNPYYP